MPTINQLPVLSTISSGDQLPVYSPNNGDARRTSIGSLLTFFQQSFASPTVSVNLFVPTAGFNITVPTPVSNQQWMLLQPAGTLASGTITLPLNTGVPDGTEVLITSTQEITALTISLNGATAIFGVVTALAAGSAFAIRYYQATNSWYALTTTIVLATGIQSWLGNPSSANLRAAMTDETGTGLLVFATSPTLTTPTITNPSVTTGTFTSPTLVTPALGTVASGNISACTSTSMVLTTPVLGVATGTSLSTTGNQVISSTGKHGYATGSGGTVTQITSKATGVTLSKSTGQITLDGAALAASTTVSFTLTNTVIEAGDILILNHISGGTAGSYLLNAQSAAGSASINVRNISLGSLSEAIVIAFAVIKAVTA
jgi:hypothetical protein